MKPLLSEYLHVFSQPAHRFELFRIWDNSLGLLLKCALLNAIVKIGILKLILLFFISTHVLHEAHLILFPDLDSLCSHHAPCEDSAGGCAFLVGTFFFQHYFFHLFYFCHNFIYLIVFEKELSFKEFNLFSLLLQIIMALFFLYYSFGSLSGSGFLVDTHQTLLHGCFGDGGELRGRSGFGEVYVMVLLPDGLKFR